MPTPFMRYATAVRLALEGSARRQKIATAFLKKSDHRFLHKELANHLGIPQVTLNGEFGKLGHHVYTILGRHPVGQQAASQWCSELVEFKWSVDGWIWIAQERFIKALEDIFMDEVETGTIIPETFSEGGSAQRKITIFERSQIAREACLKEFGAGCFICQFDFGERYGSRFGGRIHVHHITPVSSRRTKYELDPRQDLRPVCPNCHYVLHLKDPPYTVEEVQVFIRNSKAMAEKVSF
jgi:5-methylcytosine-specific restriction protein A